MWDLTTHTCYNNLPLKCESIHSWICSPSSGSFLHPTLQAIVVDSPPQKINLISCEPLVHISDIKLIRTDTTLDLSQKAEKGMSCNTSLLLVLYELCVLLFPKLSDVGLLCSRYKMK
ncbi:unnamed protein product [Trifolium pratense]|uniref:Uncharacterized protein n=1 Tax=Trifolium pratense TaxID=57577 RepID=A0ACB0M9F2_TRIPR|nr:unnamed protein product [Trifolium pratense]